MIIKKTKIPVKQIVTFGLLPSPIKKLFYRMKGYKIGKSVSFGLGSVIIGEDVVIENNTSVGFLTVVRAKKIKIGRYVRIGSLTMIDTEKIEIDDDARINEQVIIGGIKNPDSYIKIGKRVIIMEMSFINPTKPIIIGDDAGIGGHCLLFTHGSWLSQIDGYPVIFAPITIGKRVWLPWRVFIMPGVNIGDNVVIGANSLVSKSLPSNCMAAGSPARVIKENYPPDLSTGQRQAILDQIFEDFIGYLEYHHCGVTKENIDKGLILRIAKQNKNHVIYYLKDSVNMETVKDDNALIILDYPEASMAKYYDNNSRMVVDLHQKKRIGHSDIGEECISYISRYGIRFDRCD